MTGIVRVGNSTKGPRVTGAMITQLNPPLPMSTPKGDGLAHFVIDYGPETDLIWVVFMEMDGACWSVRNPEVRMKWNWTMGRREAETCKPLAQAEAGSRVHVFPRPNED